MWTLRTRVRERLRIERPVGNRELFFATELPALVSYVPDAAPTTSQGGGGGHRRRVRAVGDAGSPCRTADAGPYPPRERGLLYPGMGVHRPGRGSDNQGAEPARVLLLISPAGMERCFAEAAEVLSAAPAGGQPDMERIKALRRRYGIADV